MKTISNYLFIALVVIALSGCEKYPSLADTQKAFVDQKSVVLYIGENAGDHSKTKITASPKDIQFRWESVNPDVAEVDQKGNVTARSLGITTIRVHAEKDITDVNVNVKQWYAFKSFKIVCDPVYNKKFMDLFQIGSSIIYTPENQTEVDDLNWSSDDPSIAKVYPYGWVRCFEPGKATITASYGGVKQTIIVNVTP